MASFCLLSKIIIQLFSNLLLKKQVKIDNGRGIFILFFAITNMVDRICSISISRIITLFFGIIL